MKAEKFTQEQVDIIKKNPYVVNVSPTRISYSLAFKKFAIEQSLKGVRSPEIFRSAGFDPEILGKTRMYVALKRFKKEASSPEGLKEPCGKSREDKLAAFAKEDLTKKQTRAAIRELQEKVVHLEQQIEFLKKIQSLGK